MMIVLMVLYTALLTECCEMIEILSAPVSMTAGDIIWIITLWTLWSYYLDYYCLNVMDANVTNTLTSAHRE